MNFTGVLIVQEREKQKNVKKVQKELVCSQTWWDDTLYQNK